MDRVEIPHPGDIVWDSSGNVRANLAVTLKLAGTATAATHYSALTGGSSTTGGLQTWTDGTIRNASGDMRYIESGVPVDLTITSLALTRRLEPYSSAAGARGFRSIREFGAVTGSDHTALFDAAAASGEQGIYVPHREGGWNYDGILDVSTEGAFWRGDKGGTTIYQRSIGRMLFDVSADGVTIEGLQLGYAPGEKATASWTYAEKDSGTNTLYNQDSTVSRSAMIYNYGGSRVTVRDVDFLNTYASIRMRSDDRYATQAEDNRVLNCRFKDFEFGLLIMNQINPFVSGLFGRDTGGLGGAPPHLIYCAGGGAIPTDVPVAGVAVTSVAATDLFTATAGSHELLIDQAMQFSSLTGGAGLSTATTYYVIADGFTDTTFKVSTTVGGASINHTTNVTAGLVGSYLADTQINGGLFSNCVDYGNPYSSSFKFRNLRGTRLGNLQSYNSARCFELSYCEGVVLDGATGRAVQSLNQDTDVPGSDSVGAALSIAYCSDIRTRNTDITLPAAEFKTGYRVEVSNDIRLKNAAVNGTFGIASGTHAFYKNVASQDVWYENPEWEHNGADSPAVRNSSSTRVRLLRPQIDSAFAEDIIVNASDCVDFDLELDRKLITPKKLEMSEMLNDSGTGTTIRYTDAGVREQKVQSTSATPKILTRDGKTLAPDNCLWFPQNTVQRVTGDVVARNTATGDGAAWTIAMVFRRGSGSSNPVQIGTDTPTKLTSDAGAAAWTLAVGISNTQDAIYFEGTGAAATTIEWRGRFVLTGEI